MWVVLFVYLFKRHVFVPRGSRYFLSRDVILDWIGFLRFMGSQKRTGLWSRWSIIVWLRSILISLQSVDPSNRCVSGSLNSPPPGSKRPLRRNIIVFTVFVFTDSPNPITAVVSPSSHSRGSLTVGYERRICLGVQNLEDFLFVPTGESLCVPMFGSVVSRAVLSVSCMNGNNSSSGSGASPISPWWHLFVHSFLPVNWVWPSL